MAPRDSSFFKILPQSDDPDGDKPPADIAAMIERAARDHPGFALPSADSYRSPKISAEVRERYERLRSVIAVVENNGGITRAAPPAQGCAIPYALELNERQLAAVTAGDGPVLVIAGAGSGKTRTLVYRVAYLLERGVEPESIMLLTFTRKAAAQMLARVDGLLKHDISGRILNGTFHSVANHLLRRFSGVLGISNTFTILDTVDAEDVIDLVRKSLELDKQKTAFPAKQRVFEVLSKARNLRMTIREVIDRDYTGLDSYAEDLERVNAEYVDYKVTNNLVDFDDLIDVLLAFLRARPEFAGALAQRYRYILVDEYQDTNIPQRELVEELAKTHRNLTVVGDDAQSIYSFRGASFENILLFPETYPGCSLIKLERNYRSTQDILSFTNDIVRNFAVAYRKELSSTDSRSGRPAAGRFFAPEDEARWIVGRVLSLREQDVPLAGLAVLYRSSFHSNYIQAELSRRSIPYVVYGGVKFSERRHVKDVVAYLRVALNPMDAVGWNRVLKLVPGVGPVTASKIVERVRERGEVNLAGLAGPRAGDALVRLEELFSILSSHGPGVAEKVRLLKGFYAEGLKEVYEDYEKRLLDIEVLESLAVRYTDLERFLSDFALDPPSNRFQEETRPRVDEGEGDRLVLSTIHSAKGLEWNQVFVPHLLDGLFPSDRSVRNIEELEEERRLFYVACTRARRRLYLTLPSSFSSWSGWYTLPSRFLAEVGAELFSYSVEMEEEDEG